MTQRDRIGLTLLAIVAGLLLCLYGLSGSTPAVPLAEAGGVESTAGVEGSPFDEPRPGPGVRRGPGGPRPPDGPPVLPRVELGDGLAVTVRRVSAGPALGEDRDAFPPQRRRRATTAAASRPSLAPFRQQVTLHLQIDDPAPTADQDHAIRIAGRPARGRGMAFLSGDSGTGGMSMAIVDPSLRRVSVEIAVPTGPFVEIERIAPGDAAARRNPDAPKAVPWVIEGIAASRAGRHGSGAGRLVVRLGEGDETDPDAFAGQTWLLQAVCKDGRVVTASGFQSMGDFGTDATINVGYDEVDHVVYRCRPRAWRTLGEIDLPATEITIITADHPNGYTTTSMAEAERLFRDYQIASTQAAPATQPGERASASFRMRSRGMSMHQSTRRPQQP